MQYAIINNKPVRAGDIAHDPTLTGRCPYCGGPVALDNDPQVRAWVHSSPAEAAACQQEQARELAELGAALGGGQ